jgi:DNA-binding CsgD family transcriptional regulator
MQPRDWLTAKEIQVAILVWQGLTNEDIAGVVLTSKQVVKNYLRTAFDKLGVWTRLELALYVAGHGGANWHMQVGNGRLPPGAGSSRGPGTSIFGQRSNQRKALRKRKAVLREAGMHRWSDGRLARPAGRGGRALHRQSFLHHWIFPMR